MNDLIKTLSCCLVLFLITGCQLTNALRMRIANLGAEPTWQSTKFKQDIETDYIGEKPHIYATINGVDGFKLLIDSGASISILQDTDKVKSLKLSQDYELALSGWGDGNNSKGYKTTVDTIVAGPIMFKNFHFAYLPASETNYFIDKKEMIYDGVIGHDFLKHFVWYFDKNANQIAVANRAHEPTNNESSLPISRLFGKISVNINVQLNKNQAITHDVNIDTGSRHYFKLPSAYVKQENITFDGLSITAADFGLNGQAEHQRTVVPHIDLANHRFYQVKANIIKQNDPDEFWVIGSALLSQYQTIIDYLTDTFYLTAPEKQTGATVRSRFNLLGLELRKLTDGQFIVRYVFPQFTAAHLGINVGDLVTSINSIPSSSITTDDWLNISNTVGEHQICFTNQQCHQITSKPIKGYSEF